MKKAYPIREHRPTWLAGLLCIAATITALHAQPVEVLSTLGLEAAIENRISANTSYNGQQYLAQSFLSGSTSLDLVSVSLNLDNAYLAPEAPLVVAIYQSIDSGSGFVPGSVLATLTLDGGASPLTAGLHTFAASTPLSLDAGTMYWIVATSTSTQGAYIWRQIDGQSPTPTTAVDGWSLTGANYVSYRDASTSWTTYEGYPESFSITALQAIPEPSTLALLTTILSLTGGYLLLHRRKTHCPEH